MDRKSDTELQKEGLNMQPDQNQGQDWTGSVIVKGVLDIVKMTIEKTPIPYQEVGKFMKEVSDSIAKAIEETDATLARVQARSGSGSALPAASDAAAAPEASAPAEAVAEAPEEASAQVPAASAPEPAQPESLPAKKRRVRSSRPKAASQDEKDDHGRAAAAANAQPESVADAPAGQEPRKERYKFAHISREPVVPINESVHPDYIVCLIDGEQRRMLHRHLRSRYGMSVEEYRAHFGLPDDYPMTAPGYSEEKRRYAIHQGLGTSRLYENAKSRKQERPTPAKVTKRKREKADSTASA